MTEPQAPGQRVVILVHGHPDYSAGGSEMAAYSLFKALPLRGWESFLISWISPELARAHDQARLIRVGASSREWAFFSPWLDGLFQSQSDLAGLRDQLVPFIADLRPDVIHLHHFMGFGVELIWLLRQALPDVRIVFTLHEFLSICQRDGQMITAPANRLCSGASHVKCIKCFPHLSRTHMWLREAWMKRHLQWVDAFTSPSHFVRDRHVAWGLEADKVTVVENAQICTVNANPGDSTEPTELLTFGFFGQISPYKGLEVLLDAVSLLAKTRRKARFRVQIHGSMQSHAEHYNARVRSMIAENDAFVTFHGAYTAESVMTLMSGVHYVMVPSIWWENSPVVIEEAFFARRPVICSDIGGMREKVQHDRNGLHFRVSDPISLAEVMMRCMDEPLLWADLQRNVRTVPSLEESADAYEAVYNSIERSPKS